jgi:hypothetical protein
LPVHPSLDSKVGEGTGFSLWPNQLQVHDSKAQIMVSTADDELYSFLFSDYRLQVGAGVKVPSWHMSLLKERFSEEEVNRFIIAGILSPTNLFQSVSVSVDVPGTAGHLVKRLIDSEPNVSVESLHSALRGRMTADNLQRYWNLVQDFRAPNYSGE